MWSPKIVMDLGYHWMSTWWTILHLGHISAVYVYLDMMCVYSNEYSSLQCGLEMITVWTVDVAPGLHDWIKQLSATAANTLKNVKHWTTINSSYFVPDYCLLSEDVFSKSKFKLVKICCLYLTEGYCLSAFQTWQKQVMMTNVPWLICCNKTFLDYLDFYFDL